MLLATLCVCVITGSAADAAARGAGVSFTGTTSQHAGRYGSQRLPSNDVAFTYSGGKVRDFSIPWEASCHAGTAAPLLDRVEITQALKVRNGSFQVSRGSYTFRPGRHQTAYVVLNKLSGKIRASRATGTLKVVAYPSEGRTGGGVCGTVIRWSAVAGARKVNLAFPAFNHPQQYFPETILVYTRTNVATGSSSIDFTFGETFFGYPVTSPSAGASDSDPAIGSGLQYLLAFQRTMSGISQIYTTPVGLGGDPEAVEAQGVGDTRLTDFRSGATDPAVSPNGQEIAFSVGTGANCSLWIMNIDGSDQRQLTNHGAGPGCDDAPTWSPNGASVAFQRVMTNAAGKRMKVSDMVVPASGGTPTALDLPGGTAGFSWAPKKKIVFLAPGGRRTPPSLQTVNPNGSDEHTVLRARGLTGRPVWYGDQDWIAFTRRERDGRTYVASIPAAGGRSFAIAPAPGTSDSDPVPVIPTRVILPRESGTGLHAITGPKPHRPHRPH